MKLNLLGRLSRMQAPLNVLIAVLIGFIIGTGLMLVEGHDLREAYTALFNGAFSGRFNFGGTLERFVPLLLSGLAFSVASKASVFNVGVEGQLYFGAMAAAYFGYRWAAQLAAHYHRARVGGFDRGRLGSYTWIPSSRLPGE